MDIAFAISMVSQFMHAHEPTHFKAAYKILGYFIEREPSLQTRSLYRCIMFGSTTNGRSTSDYFSFGGENLVTWRSKKQNVVTKSNVEVALAHVICEGIWIKRILEQLMFSQAKPIQKFSGNKTVISIAHNPVLHDRPLHTKHIEVNTF